MPCFFSKSFIFYLSHSFQRSYCYAALFLYLIHFSTFTDPPASSGPALAAQTGVNLDGNVSNVLASTPVFAGSYSATPNQARVGQAITLNATITDKSGSLSNAM